VAAGPVTQMSQRRSGTAGQSGQPLLLEEYAPRSELVLPATAVARPRFPVIDAHNHLGEEFGGGWDRRAVDELLDVLDEAGVRCLVDLDGGWGEHVLDAHLAAFKETAPDRFVCFGGVDWSAWPELGDRFPDWAAARLTAQVRRGAQGLKIWKPFGLRVVDHRGRRIAVNDPRLDVLWATAAELRVPVTIHVADPVAFFRPLDRHNERYELLREHPDWHAAGAECPSFEAIIGEFASLVMRHEDTIFIGAHVGCYAENLAWVSALLDRCPNLYVDIGARLDELGRQPYTSRRFFLRHRRRILFGADFPVDVAMYRTHYRFLETEDEQFSGPGGDRPGRSWRLIGLNLPDDVLERVYSVNAYELLMSEPG
jgi:predicted TIM-barrel fold metal-dependent hydrolase